MHRVVRNKGRLECPLDSCSKGYLNRDDFQAHLRKVHNVEFEAAEDASVPDADETCQRGAGGTLDIPQAFDRLLMLMH